MMSQHCLCDRERRAARRCCGRVCRCGGTQDRMWRGGRADHLAGTGMDGLCMIFDSLPVPDTKGLLLCPPGVPVAVGRVCAPVYCDAAAVLCTAPNHHSTAQACRYVKPCRVWQHCVKALRNGCKVCRHTGEVRCADGFGQGDSCGWGLGHEPDDALPDSSGGY